MSIRHILICGARGSGKSTLIEKLTKELHIPVYGFVTRMFKADDDGFCPLHMFSAADPQRQRTVENHVADCDGSKPRVNPAVFDSLGLELLKKRPGVLVMDELGIMENDSPKFCSAVLEHLDADAPIIAAVKAKRSVFLDGVRNHPKAQCFTITTENRDELYHELLPVIQSWNRELSCTQH